MAGEHQDMTGQNGNGFTTKDTIIRVEGKMDAFITAHTIQHNELVSVIQKLAQEFAVHTADDHPAHVAKLRDAELRDEGRRDMLRVIFGTSIAGLIFGAGGLIIGLAKLLGG